MADIFAVGACSEVTKPKTHPAGSHLVVISTHLSPASSAQQATLLVFAHGDKGLRDELALLMVEEQAIAAGTGVQAALTPEKTARIVTLKASALDTLADCGRVDILKHIHVPRLVELSKPIQPQPSVDPLIGKVVANIAVTDDDGDAMLILDGKISAKEGDKYRVVSTADSAVSGLASAAAVAKALAGVANSAQGSPPSVDVSGCSQPVSDASTLTAPRFKQ